MSRCDALASDALLSVGPRTGFEAELRVELGRAGRMPVLVPPVGPGPRIRWLVYGGVAAGVVSATGAAFWGLRRHQQRGAA